jgi:hypothetical protein
VHDVLTAVRFAGDRASLSEVTLVGLGPVAGPLVAAARAQADAPLRAVLDVAGFRFEDVARYDDPMFVPGAAKYLDLPALLSLGGGGDLWRPGAGDGDDDAAAIEWVARRP